MGGFCERWRKLIHKEIHSQFVNTLVYKDIRNFSGKMNKARSFQLNPLSTDIEETHEALTF
jgi:hypothetical protein